MLEATAQQGAGGVCCCEDTDSREEAQGGQSKTIGVLIIISALLRLIWPQRYVYMLEQILNTDQKPLWYKQNVCTHYADRDGSSNRAILKASKRRMTGQYTGFQQSCKTHSFVSHLVVKDIVGRVPSAASGRNKELKIKHNFIACRFLHLLILSSAHFTHFNLLLLEAAPFLILPCIT